MSNSVSLRIIAILILVSALAAFIPTGVFAAEHEIVKDGLVAWYDGKNNTRNGHNADSLVWEDLVGNNDVTVAKNGTNYFTDDAFHLNKAQYVLPDTLINLVNSREFTVELALGDLVLTGTDHAVLLNNINGNDNFSLFLRRSGDYLEFKGGSNSRPKASGGQDYLQNSTVTITFKVGGECKLYVDGVLIQTKAASSTIGATGNLFFGHAASSRSHETDYKSMRFYNRALTHEEVINNAKADGTCEYVIPPEFVEFNEPFTNVIGDISLSEYVESAQELSALVSTEKAPSNAIFYVNADLKVTDSSYKNVFSTVSDVVSALDEKIIPTFYVADTESAAALAAELKEMKLSDAFVMSDSPETVKAARTAYTKIRGIIDYTKLFSNVQIEEEDLIEVRRTTSKNLANIAVLPASAVTREDVKYLNSRQITTWVCADSSLDSTEAMRLLVSETYGIISDNTALILDVANRYIKENSLTRTPMIIGHRGAPHAYPENTIASAKEALRVGADVVEIDVYMTTDGHLVLNHDATTTGYNQELAVEESTLAELRSIYREYGGVKYYIDTLDDMLAAMKGEDVMVFIEIKSNKKDVVAEIKRIVEKHDIYEQCAVIVFGNKNLLPVVAEVYPEMPTGYLAMDEYAGEDMLESIQETIGKTNSTYNPKMLGYDTDFVRLCTMRGITVWPWTINSSAELRAAMITGFAGITTDHPNRPASFIENFTLASGEKSVFAIGETLTLSAEKTSYAGEKSLANATYIIIEGEELATVSGDTVSFSGVGKVSVIACQTEQNNDVTYTVYSDPVTFVVEGAAGDDNVGDGDNAGGDDNVGDGDNAGDDDNVGDGDNAGDDDNVGSDNANDGDNANDTTDKNEENVDDGGADVEGEPVGGASGGGCAGGATISDGDSSIAYNRAGDMLFICGAILIAIIIKKKIYA